MTNDELEVTLERIESTENQNSKIKYYLSNFIISAINFDEYKFNTLFSKALKEFDFILFYKSIILPLLKRVGVLWLTNKMSPSQEHFISELIKQLYVLIDQNSANIQPKTNGCYFFRKMNFMKSDLFLPNTFYY